MTNGAKMEWNVVACISKCGFQHQSYVNGIYTKDGGKHVDFVMNRIYKPVKDLLIQKSKQGANVETEHIKQQLWLFINAVIINPDFDSQSKTKLTTKVSEFQFECAKLPEKFIADLVGKCKLGTIALQYGKFRSDVDTAR